MKRKLILPIIMIFMMLIMGTSITYAATCPRCNGTGKQTSTSVCSLCKGTGTTSSNSGNSSGNSGNSSGNSGNSSSSSGNSSSSSGNSSSSSGNSSGNSGLTPGTGCLTCNNTGMISGIPCYNCSAGTRNAQTKVDTGSFKPNALTEDDYKEAFNMTSTIVNIITVVGIVMSVVMLMILGIKYMMGSIEEKAEYKKTMMPMFIGAILIFCSSTIVSIIYNIVSQIR